jgi:hypothetical protein
MTQLGIPLTKNSISMLLKEINTLNRINEGTNLLQYTNWLGKPITMVSIPTSKNESTFLSQHKNYFNWLDSLPSYVIGTNTELNEAEVAGWIMRRLANIFEDEFVKVAWKLGYSFNSVTMDTDTTMAMWQESNSTLKHEWHFRKELFDSFQLPHRQKDKEDSV